MANISANLSTAVLQAIDTLTSTARVNSPMPLISLAASVVYYESYFTVDATATVVPLPAPTIFILFIRNLDTLGTVNITCAITPSASTSSNFVLTTGSVFMYWAQSETTGGITAVSLTGSATTNAEIFAAA